MITPGSRCAMGYTFRMVTRGESPAPDRGESMDALLVRVTDKLLHLIPRDQRPSLKASSRIQGIPAALRKQILDESEKRVGRLRAKFPSPATPHGKLLEVMLAAFVVKNDEQKGGFHWAGRKSTAILAHEGQDFLEGKTDVIFALEGPRESHQPSLTILRVDANTGSTSFFKKLRRTMTWLERTGSMGELPFTTLRLGGGLDVQGANLERAPHVLVNFSPATVEMLARKCDKNLDNDHNYAALASDTTQLLMLKQIEAQLDGYRSFFKSKLPELEARWGRRLREIDAEIKNVTGDADSESKRRKIGGLKAEQYVLERALSTKSQGDMFQAMAQNRNAIRERFLERVSAIYRSELSAFSNRLSEEIPRLRSIFGDRNNPAGLKALDAVETDLGLQRRTGDIVLSNVEALYREAFRTESIPDDSILVQRPDDALHRQAMVAFSPEILREVSEIPEEDWKDREEAGTRSMGPAYERLRRLVEERSKSESEKPLVSEQDLIEALDKFPLFKPHIVSTHQIIEDRRVMFQEETSARLESAWARWLKHDAYRFLIQRIPDDDAFQRHTVRLLLELPPQATFKLRQALGVIDNNVKLSERHAAKIRALIDSGLIGRSFFEGEFKVEDEDVLAAAQQSAPVTNRTDTGEVHPSLANEMGTLEWQQRWNAPKVAEPVAPRDGAVSVSTDAANLPTSSDADSAIPTIDDAQSGVQGADAVTVGAGDAADAAATDAAVLAAATDDVGGGAAADAPAPLAANPIIPAPAGAPADPVMGDVPPLPAVPPPASPDRVVPDYNALRDAYRAAEARVQAQIDALRAENAAQEARLAAPREPAAPHSPDAHHDHHAGDGGGHGHDGGGHDAGGHAGGHGAHGGHDHGHGHGHHEPLHLPRNLSEWGSLVAAVAFGIGALVKGAWTYVTHPILHALGYVITDEKKTPWTKLVSNLGDGFKKMFGFKGGHKAASHGSDHGASHGGGGHKH